MNIEETLLERHSRVQSELVATYIGKNPKRFEELMEIVFSSDTRALNRAAWTMNHCCEAHPELIQPWLPKLIDALSKDDATDALKRNAVRILQTVDFPEKLTGRIFNLCYAFLNDPDEAAAVRIFSMSVLARICEDEPDLADEIETLVRQHLPHSTKGYQARSRKVLKDLEKIKKNKRH